MAEELIPLEVQTDAETLEAVMLADEVSEGALLVTVQSPQEQEFAADELKNIVSRRDRLKAAQERLAYPFKVGLDRLNEFFGEPLKRLKVGEDAIRRAIVAYQQQAQAKLLTDRDGRMSTIEEKVMELRAQSDELEVASNIKTNMDEAEECANKAAELRRQADELAQQHVPLERPAQTAGVSTRSNWQGELTDLDKLIDYAYENRQFRTLLTVNQTALNAHAKMTKGAVDVPGVRVYDKGTTVVRRNRRSAESPQP
jgi:hypothetical protein